MIVMRPITLNVLENKPRKKMQKKNLVKAMAGNQFRVFDALLREMKLEFVRYIIQRFFCDFQLNENPSV